MNNIDLLKESLLSKQVSLVLGAGFSFGANNQSGKPVPVGKQLAKQLFQEMFPDPSQQGYSLAEVNKENLQKLCSIIEYQGQHRINQRDSLLTDIFTGCHPSNDSSYHYYVADYPWATIFTLNIDDLVENIYATKRKKINVWNGTNYGEHLPNHTLLVKLHGCVHSNPHNYVFSESEYLAFASSESCFLREYATACTRNDMVLIGTEYQENDLKQIINTYKSSGYKCPNKFFFINPGIKDDTLKFAIETTENFYSIEWTTQQFLQFLHDNIHGRRDIETELREKGMIFVDDPALIGEDLYVSEIYNGKDSRYADFWQNWNISYPYKDSLIEKILLSPNRFQLCLHGYSYVGKTCVARQILIELSRMSYTCREFAINSTTVSSMFLHYLKYLPEGSSVALLCENAAYHYHHISYVLKNIPSNIAKIVIITVDNTQSHLQKMNDIDCSFFVHQVSEAIDTQYAKNIFGKLQQHHMLSKLQTYAETPAEIRNFIKRTNDLIEVLYLASSGRYFSDYLNDNLHAHNNPVSQHYFLALTTLGVLGINSLPIRIFKHLLPSVSASLDMDTFLADYSDWVIINNDYIKIRGLRLLQKCMTDILGSEKVIEIMVQVASQTAGQFTEDYSNEWSELFQKTLLIKNILNHKILTIEQAREVFIRLEESCKKYSYYWVQRGLLEQKATRYEYAESYLLKAKSIRSSSYQIKHAIAKNYMERGLFEFDNGITSADYFYDEGLKQMMDLIVSDDPIDSKARPYSVHSLIVMQLKHSQITSKSLTEDACNYMASRLSELEIDNELKAIASTLQKYCNNHCYQNASKIIDLALQHARYISERRSYDLDFSW